MIDTTNTTKVYNPGIDSNIVDWINLHRNENLFIDEKYLKSKVLNANTTNTVNVYNPGIDSNAPDWINLHRNENLFIDEKYIKSIVLNAIENTCILKMPDSQQTNLKNKIAKFHNVLPENVFIGNGADEVLSSLFFLMRKRFDTVILPKICFKMYNHFANKYNFTINNFANYPLLDKNNLANLEGFFVIDSPASIQGEAIDQALLNNIYLNKKNFLIWDNVHGPFCNDKIDGIKENLVVVRHFTHFYGLAALRIGYCIASTAVVEELNMYREPFNVNQIALSAAEACLNNHDYFISLIPQMLEAKNKFLKLLQSLSFTTSNSVVNSYLIKHATIKSKYIYEKLLENKIATRHYGDDDFLKNYLRVSVPCPTDFEKVSTCLKGIINNEI